MITLIAKFDNGGVIDVNTLRNDVKADPRFYDKKNGSFTKSGKERLAAIEEINTVQGKGLRYDIDGKSSTFKIVDKNGNKVETVEGRGVGSNTNVHPFYGLINKEKRSMKEVSTILGKPKYLTTSKEIQKDLSKNKAEENIYNIDKPTEVIENINNKVNDPVLQREKKQLESKQILQKSPTAANIVSGSINNFIPESAIDKQDHQYLSDKLKNISISDTNNMLPEELNELNSYAEKLKDMKKVLKEGPKPFPDFSKMRKDLMQEKDSIINSKEDPSVKSSKLEAIEKNLRSIRNSVPAIQDINEVRDNYKNTLKEILPKYRDLMSKNFGDAITKQKQVMLELDSDKYSDAIKKAYKPQFELSINGLESARDKYYNSSDEDIVDKIIGNFGKMSTFRLGGVLKFQFGGGQVYNYKDTDYESLSQDGENPNANIISIIASNGNKSGMPTLRQANNYKDEFPGEENPNSSTFTRTPSSSINTEKTLGTEEDPAFIKQEAEPNIRKGNFLNKTKGIISTTGVNTPLGQIQYNDILQLILLNKAHNKPVTTVKPFQEKFQAHGVRNVQSARDIDASSIQAAKSAISSLNAEYKGSDPIMSVLAKSSVQQKKVDATNDLISKRANYRRQEEDRVNGDMEERRLQGADDLIKSNDVTNRNNERTYLSDTMTAQAKAAKEAAYWNGIGELGSGIQKRFNEESANKKQYLSGVKAMDRQMEIEGAYKPLMDTKSKKNFLETNISFERDPILKAEKQSQLDELNKLYETHLSEYNRIRSKTSDAEGVYDDINKVDSVAANSRKIFK